MTRIAMLSVHSCPLAALGGKETGGMNVYIRELSKALSESGCSIDIFTRSMNRLVPQVVPLVEGVRIIHLKAGPEAPYEKYRIWFHLPEFMNNLEEFRQREGIGYRLIHSHYWLSGWIGIQLSKRWSVPLLHMFHTLGHFKNNAIPRRGEREPEVRLCVERQLVSASDHITAASIKEKNDLMGEYGGHPEKISVVPCGVDIRFFRPLDASASKKHLNLADRHIILFVGRIDPIKGIDTLLKAMAILTQNPGRARAVELLVVGGNKDEMKGMGGSEIRRLKRMTAEMNLETTVTFLGAQRQDRLPYFYSAAEACILPSRYESFGMVALEAMACATPVIASEVGGLTSLIQHGKTGFLVPEGNERALAEKISLLLDNPSLKQTMGRNARSQSLHYNWHAVAERILFLYGKLCGESIGRWQPRLYGTHVSTGAPATCCSAPGI